MAGVREILSSISGWLKEIVNLGFSIILVFLVIDLIFGMTTNIVGNVSALVSQFTGKGVVGLITLMVFLAVYSK